MENQSNNQAARIFAGAFAQSLAESLTKAASIPWKATVLDAPDLAKSGGRSIHFRLSVGGGLRGECFVEFSEPQVTELAASILGRPISVFGAEQQEALAKIISSAMNGVAVTLSPRYGEIECKVQPVEGLAFGGMFVVPLSASGGSQSAMPVLLYFDGQLLTALSAQPNTRTAAEAETPSIDLANLKLVMDVDLNVSLRFGQRQLPLREVLELASGSVIELDRQVDDPVELLLDGKVIARGEAVIVDGNYGLRVTEIPQPIASHFLH
jgi:flagellar motor switch protein FliN/FliY